MALESFIRASQVTLEKTSNKIDHFSLTYADYAYKAGAWRLLDLMDEFKIKGSVSTNGLTAERQPKVVRAFADFGCEIVGHGWAQDMLAKDDDPETELAEMRKVTAILTEVAGTRPVGWVSQGSAGSTNTLDFLKGEGYLWSGDDMSDDLPFLKQTQHGPIVILPRVNLPHNDLWMWATARNPPEYMWSGWKATFDQLYAEGLGGRAEMVRTDAACTHGRTSDDDPGGAPNAAIRDETQEGSGSHVVAKSPSGRWITRKGKWWAHENRRESSRRILRLRDRDERGVPFRMHSRSS